MKARINLFWQNRSAREQKILCVWGLIVGGGLLYFGLLSPLQQNIARLQRSIPALEGQLFAMRAQPTRGIRNGQATVSNSGDLRSKLFQLLSARKSNADLRSLSAERVELRLPELPIADALALADSLRLDAQAPIVALSIKRDTPNSPALVVLELERIR